MSIEACDFATNQNSKIHNISSRPVHHLKNLKLETLPRTMHYKAPSMNVIIQKNFCCAPGLLGAISESALISQRLLLMDRMQKKKSP